MIENIAYIAILTVAIIQLMTSRMIFDLTDSPFEYVFYTLFYVFMIIDTTIKYVIYEYTKMHLPRDDSRRIFSRLLAILPALMYIVIGLYIINSIHTWVYSQQKYLTTNGIHFLTMTMLMIANFLAFRTARLRRSIDFILKEE